MLKNFKVNLGWMCHVVSVCPITQVSEPGRGSRGLGCLTDSEH